MTTLYRIRGRSHIPAPFIHNPTGECKWGDLETLARSSFTTEIVRPPRHWIIYIPSTPHDSTWHNILPAYIKTQPHELLVALHKKSKNSDFKFSYILFSKKHFVPKQWTTWIILHIQAKRFTNKNYIHAHKFGTKNQIVKQ